MHAGMVETAGYCTYSTFPLPPHSNYFGSLNLDLYPKIVCADVIPCLRKVTMLHHEYYKFMLPYKLDYKL